MESRKRKFLGRRPKETISWLWESFGPLCLEGLRDSDAAEWGLGTCAYSRPEGDRQINWSWDVCFLRVKWSGANGENLPRDGDSRRRCSGGAS